MGSDSELKRLEAKMRKKEGEASGEKKEKPRPKTETKTESIIRMAETNLDGTKLVRDAIRRIKGVSYMTANFISKKSGLGEKVLGDLSDQERASLEDMVMHPDKIGLPSWMCNRRRDPETGADRHLAVSEMDFIKKTDIDNMRKFKTYKGVRHSAGLPVRGQRTRGSFRKNSTVGVSKKKQQPAKKKK